MRRETIAPWSPHFVGFDREHSVKKRWQTCWRYALCVDFISIIASIARVLGTHCVVTTVFRFPTNNPEALSVCLHRQAGVFVFFAVLLGSR